MEFDLDIAHPLYKEFPLDMVERVTNKYRCEIDEEFPCFADQYKHLSMCIPHPEKTTVLDFGCYLATQCAYFKGFKAYIGIDCEDLVRFSTPNVTHYCKSIKRFLEEDAHKYVNEQNFAICNYSVHDFALLQEIQQLFPNCFFYYPRLDQKVNIFPF